MSDEPAGDRRRVVAEVIGVPAPGVAVWRGVDVPDLTGDLDPAPADVAAGDSLVLDVVRDHFRWLVVDVVDFVPRMRRSGRRPRSPHAHPARPPGTVLIAWLPFTNEDEAPGKHRPCVVLHSSVADFLRVRPLFDPASATARSDPDAVPLRSWRAAGLGKASVAGSPVEVPVGRCEQTVGALLPHDRAALGITG